MGLYDPTPQDHEHFRIREALRELEILDQLDPDGPGDRRPHWMPEEEWEACREQFRRTYDLGP